MELGCRLIPVIVIDDAARAHDLGHALVAGGLSVAEVTFRTDAAVAAMTAMAEVPGLTVGAGTILTSVQVKQAQAAGAQFVVSPGFSREVVETCQTQGLFALPGVATATEVMAALNSGCDVLKFFPAEANGGVATVKALAAAFRQVRFIPTGGIGPQNLADYLAVPCVAAVGGSWMVPAQALAAGDMELIETLAREAVTLAAQY